MNDDRSKEQKLATVERRFQFSLILALFMPSISASIMKIFPGMVEKMGEDGSGFSGAVLAYVLINYFLLETCRNKLSAKRLDLISNTLLFLSFGLVGVTALTISVAHSPWSGLQNLALSAAMLSSLFLSAFLMSVILWGAGVQMVKEMFPGKFKR